MNGRVLPGAKGRTSSKNRAPKIHLEARGHSVILLPALLHLGAHRPKGPQHFSWTGYWGAALTGLDFPVTA